MKMTIEEAREFLINISYKLGNMSVEYLSEKDGEKMRDVIKALEQEPKSYQWCTDCKEYNQEKHCCHRWSNVIRNTVAEMKQEYVEREALDKIRAEIEERPTYDPKFEEKYTAYGMRCDVLEIIDKYKAEQEET